MKKILIALALLVPVIGHSYIEPKQVSDFTYETCDNTTQMASELYDMRVHGSSKKQMLNMLNEQAKQLKLKNKLDESQLAVAKHIINTLYSSNVDLSTLGTPKDKQMFLYTVYALCVQGNI